MIPTGTIVFIIRVCVCVALLSQDKNKATNIASHMLGDNISRQKEGH